MLAIGVTGGFGSGKTLVCKIFACFGIPVYYSDEQAHMLTEKDPAILKSIGEAFGPGLIDSGRLDRGALADIVFRDRKALERLNAIIHPAVRRDVEAWMDRQKGVPYIIQETAILFESGAYNRMDGIISVSAPLETRINRVMKRDGIARQQVIDRINSQLDQSEMDKRADVVIHNDGEKMLIPQIVEIHEKILGKELFL